MKMADFLMARADAEPVTERFPIGETGFSFDRGQRPAASLTPWVAGEAIPDGAREVLERHEHFAGISGLLRVTTESDAANEVRAEWVLCRCASGLVSMIVRDGSTCGPAQLLDDVAFALAEAERYCASSVVVLVQSNDTAQSHACRSALQQAFSVSSVAPDLLYRSGEPAPLPVWFASLSGAR